MKRLLSILLVFALLCAMLSSCKGEPNEETYVILGKVGDVDYRVFFDPNEKLLNAIHTYSPKNSIVASKEIEKEE